MFLAQPTLFEVPVLPRTQKFIRVNLRDEAGRPQSMLASPEALGPGLMLWAMAQSQKVHLFTNFKPRPGYLERSPCQRQFHPDDCTVEIGVGIQQYHQSRHQRLLNHAEIGVFCNMVDYMIENEVVQFCQAAPHVAPLTRIKAFCDRYDFSPNDISEDALKQMYLRHRKGTGGRGFATQVFQNFQFMPLGLAA